MDNLDIRDPFWLLFLEDLFEGLYRVIALEYWALVDNSRKHPCFQVKHRRSIQVVEDRNDILPWQGFQGREKIGIEGRDQVDCLDLVLVLCKHIQDLVVPVAWLQFGADVLHLAGNLRVSCFEQSLESFQTHGIYVWGVRNLYIFLIALDDQYRLLL